MAKSATTTPAPGLPLPELLHTRFDRHPERHPGLTWIHVQARLDAATPAQLRALQAMERTGGEPDVVGAPRGDGAVTFIDCSPQTPAGRVSVCYDRAALEARKTHKPAHSALELAATMGVTLLDETAYHNLQSVGAFDTRTSSWLLTPPTIRRLGGALFGDRRYDRVFIYHNGAESYFGVRGFRASIVL